MKRVAGVIFLVKDLGESIEFYESLGFEFKTHVPNVAATAYINQFWIELLRKDKVVTEAFKSDVDASPKGTGQYMHINVDDIDEFYDGVVAKGLKPFSKPQNFPWGHREFVLTDPDGYKIVFFNKI